MVSKDGKKDAQKERKTKSICAREMMNQTHIVKEKHWISSA
jgi:hypothetical protein